MPLPADDVLAIQQLVALHGHLIDDGELDRLDELFTPDAVYDVTAMGGGTLHGIVEFRGAAEGDAGRRSHHVTNIVVRQADDDTVTVHSKGLGVQNDGRTGSVIYDDVVVRTERGWRIAQRRVSVR